MRRVPLVSGTRIVRVPVTDEDVVVRPPAPPLHVVDTSPAVRDAMRFPLSGPALRELVPRRGRATVVVETPELPFPDVGTDPRRDALAAVLDELAAAGIAGERQTLVVAGGLARRASRRELEQLLPPTSARAFSGQIVVHDAESPDLVEIASTDDRPIRIEPAVVETDLVVVVSAAETVVHGGPGALGAACDAQTVRSLAGIDSLAQASGAREWSTLLEIEAAVARRARVFGVSLALDHPRLSGALAGYPDDEATDEIVLRSPFRRLAARLPDAMRRRIAQDLPRRTATTGAYGGSPSVAHAEALLRGLARRAARLAEPVDALVVGVPWAGPHVPRETPNPVTAAAVALGFALRLWRDVFPVRPGGTVVLAYPLRRSFARGHEDPYRAMFESLPTLEQDALDEAERRASADERILAAYRSGQSCHPLLPYADWAGCRPALARAGRVVVAGCRDSACARALGFVPSHSLGSALEMAHGLAGGRARVGVLLAPPYAPLLVGEPGGPLPP